ncbi:MAG: hypothetical protein OXT64_00410 [Gammaproteobacteria bacterium]|nr:hypothetical protein [Gammaproteobacteria bacterium]
MLATLYRIVRDALEGGAQGDIVQDRLVDGRLDRFRGVQRGDARAQGVVDRGELRCASLAGI